MVNGSERERYAQAIMAVWKWQADCGGDQRAKIKAKWRVRGGDFRRQDFHGHHDRAVVRCKPDVTVT
jgi:hypothetical protein